MNKKFVTSSCQLMVAVVLSLLATVARAERTVVTLEKAGSLSSVLGSDVTDVKIIGPLNGTDVKYLRGLTLDQRLQAIDLSEARIVSGGVAYYETYSTEDDVIGDYMFAECSRLSSIVFPEGIRSIGMRAFTKTGLTEVVVPNSVTHLGYDSFAYCPKLATVVIGRKVSKFEQGVFWESPVKMAYVKPLTPPSLVLYEFSSSPIIRVYSESLSEYRNSDWKSFGSLVGRLEDTYPLEKDSLEVDAEVLATFFEDAACTTLKPAYQALSDEDLAAAMTKGGMTDDLIAIAKKIKNNDWAEYEKDFRIHSYKAYSDANYWNDALRTSAGSYMGNPTGIYASNYDPIYIFVDQDIPDDATLYIDGCIENDLISKAKSGKKLAKGLNIVDGVKGALYYILYTADTQKKDKALSEWPAITIHIEGGQVNGYYDVARHSDKDYAAILKAAKHPRFTVKGEMTLFHFKTATYREVWPNSIDRSISWYDSLAVWENELMGFCVSVAEGRRDYAPHNLSGGTGIFPRYYNNPYFAIEGEEADAGWANSTSYRTSYNSVTCVAQSFNVTRDDQDVWCAAHECGHNNQGAINLENCTESSNNLFSNMMRFVDGRTITDGLPISTMMDDYANHTPFFLRNISSTMRMYFQLYLYYHQARHDTSFYPRLFEALREDPMTLWQASNKSTLKFVRKVCEVAGEDLTDFFRAWGFFEPCTNVEVNDYGTHKMTVRKGDIERTLKEIALYPRKNREILFIEDRTENMYTTDYFTTPGQVRRRSDQWVGKCGQLGQYTCYLPGGCEPAEYSYYQADSLFCMTGKGGVGFIVLGPDEQLLYASNSLKFCIPASVGKDYTIYSVDADGTLRECDKLGDAKEFVHVAAAGTLADSLSMNAIHATIDGTMNGTDVKYLRELIAEHNLQSINLADVKFTSGGDAYFETYKTSSRIMGERMFYQCANLKVCRLPESVIRIAPEALSYSGLKEAYVHDGINSIERAAFSNCSSLTQVVIGAKVRTLAQGAFWDSSVRDVYVKPTTPPTLGVYIFNSNPVIHVYAKALEAYKKSAWADYGTLVGDLDDYEDIASGIEPQPAVTLAAATVVSGEAGCVTVDGLADGAVIRAFAPDGTLIAEACAQQGTAYLDVASRAGQTVILDLNGTHAKVIVRP